MTNCSRCYRPATVEVYGKFRNGREAIDPRCKDHAPIPEYIGTWTFLGSGETPFRIVGIR